MNAIVEKKTCGLVMPISAIDSCTADHWVEVKQIIMEAVESITDVPFEIRLVSEADDVGVIQNRIVQNIYSSDIVVCDLSAKNANVMFELGMRLAFDKPTVLIKDDSTDYSFDTGIIEHITYRRDLRFSSMVAFKKILAHKVLSTYNESLTSNYSMFLKHFGTFSASSLKEAEASPDRIVIEMLGDLRSEVTRLRRSVNEKQFHTSHSTPSAVRNSRIRRCLAEWSAKNDKSLTPDLLHDSDFIKEMMDSTQASSMFESPGEFGVALERQIRLFLGDTKE